jgi:acetyl-CoA carboxylase biotin carboxyl carrier protein
VAEDEKTDKAVNPELEQLQKLYEFMLEKRLDAVELKEEGSLIRLTRRPLHVPSNAQAGHAHAPAEPPKAGAPPEAVSGAGTIQTPLAGVFYRASSPTSASFVKEGDVVDPGQTLCIVEAMKVMNEIKAEARCRIVKIVAENGRPVTAGQALFQTEPA